MKNSRHLVPILTLFGLLLASCSGIKPGGASKGTKFYESFYFGEEGTQYFIKPFEIPGENKKEELVMDITFRYKDVLKDTAQVNISIMSMEIIKQLDHIVFSSGSTNVRCEDIDLLFNEVEKSHYKSRFAVSMPVVDLRELFRDPAWVITVPVGTSEKRFIAKGKSKKILGQLERGLFVLTN